MEGEISREAQLGDEALYVYHTKCNLKTAIDGSVWQWHQDYGTWNLDGVPKPSLTTALIRPDRDCLPCDCRG
ncbi:protein of unknown function (plasmid) [Cupriavidus taiwanensis]|uniref:Uncharacterized protein n=1 Tax=Cupriavidus taiwanensis TaxID=164546 RepID=A0A9Q7V1J8_9BURK|nr:hypothetical protein [Cupriavidus taiwanensis]SPD68626.1 protein of unknown function [Cupriavidus taiwanensis]